MQLTGIAFSEFFTQLMIFGIFAERSGDKIAYSRGDGSGLHDIIVQDLSSGKKIRITSDSGKNENPVFSPDGRFIAFSSTRKCKKQIYIASLDGIVQRKLSDIPGSSSTPAWEP